MVTQDNVEKVRNPMRTHIRIPGDSPILQEIQEEYAGSLIKIARPVKPSEFPIFKNNYDIFDDIEGFVDEYLARQESASGNNFITTTSHSEDSGKIVYSDTATQRQYQLVVSSRD